MLDRATLCDLWRSDIARSLGLPSSAEFFSIPHGFATEVHHVSTDRQDFILRIYPRDSKGRFRSYLAAHEAFEQIGALMPRIIGTGKVEGKRWVLETRIEGKSFRDLLDSPEAVMRAAQTLATFHRHERRRYGEVGGWGGFRLGLRWRQRFLERWSKVVQLFPELGEVTEQVRDWFEMWVDSYSPNRYQLLHRDYHPGNLILTDDGRVAVLDLRSPRFGFGLLEMIEAAHHFTGEGPGEWKPFLESYLDARGETARIEYDHFGRSIHAVFHLRHADRFANLAVGDRGKVDDRRRWERNALDSWNRFCALTGVVSPSVDATAESAFSSPRIAERTADDFLKV